MPSIDVFSSKITYSYQIFTYLTILYLNNNNNFYIQGEEKTIVLIKLSYNLLLDTILKIKLGATFFVFLFFLFLVIW